jgi:hypothetical protein
MRHPPNYWADAMTAKKKSVFVIFALVAITTAAGLSLLREARSNALHSCVASIHSYLDMRPEVISAIGITPRSEWVTVSDDDLRTVFSKIPDASLDCATFVKRTSDGMLDPWQNHIRIAVRQTGRIEFVVWSTGPDGASRTLDDVVSVPGQAPE